MAPSNAARLQYKSLRTMNESEERQRKRREYERRQEESQLIAQEKKKSSEKDLAQFCCPITFNLGDLRSFSQQSQS